MSVGLWVVQALLAVLFVATGGMKLVMPADQLTAQMPFPEMFLRFIAVCEVLGALGLILPGLLGIWTHLTPLAAAGLVIIMVGATVVTLFTMGTLMAALPLVSGILAALVAYGRWRVEPLRERTSEERRYSMSR
jgi:DoxX-like protein